MFRCCQQIRHGADRRGAMRTSHSNSRLPAAGWKKPRIARPSRATIRADLAVESWAFQRIYAGNAPIQIGKRHRKTCVVPSVDALTSARSGGAIAVRQVHTRHRQAGSTRAICAQRVDLAIDNGRIFRHIGRFSAPRRYHSLRASAVLITLAVERIELAGQAEMLLRPAALMSESAGAAHWRAGTS